MSAIGLELSLDAEMVAVVRATSRPDQGKGHFHLEELFYGPAAAVGGVVAGAAVWLDPMPCAGLLPTLRHAGCWPRLLEATDVAAASYEFREAVRARLLSADPSEALRSAMMFAMRRPLAAAFAFDRRRAAADQSMLNACCFARWGANVPEPQIF